MAILRSAPERTFACKLHLLEEFAGNWRQVYISETLYILDSAQEFLAVVDFDKDGKKEIVFSSVSLGNSFGTKCVYLYVPSLDRVYVARAQYNWCAPAEPPVQLSTEPAPSDEKDRKWLNALEGVIRSMRAIDPLPQIDFDDPIHAVARWHRDNPAPCSGTLQIHPFPGLPRSTASTSVVLDDGDITWIAYFKGPVYGHMKSRDQHFVVYSPRWSYHWAHCLLANQRFLWIGTGGDGIIRYDKSTRRLSRIMLGYSGKTISVVTSIERLGNRFRINGATDFSTGELES
ncbi:MAG TPA: hypothetical protein VGY31_08635 [Terriglobia bacterium]|nr:hypothetical protein [Terriglobia bacterium]